MAMAMSDASSSEQWAVSAKMSPIRRYSSWVVSTKKRTKQSREAARQNRPRKRPLEAPRQSTRSWDLISRIWALSSVVNLPEQSGSITAVQMNRRVRILLGAETDVSPAEVKHGGSDERVLDEERIEERSSIQDEIAQEDVPTARNVAGQLPQTVMPDRLVLYSCQLTISMIETFRLDSNARKVSSDHQKSSIDRLRLYKSIENVIFFK